MWVVRNCDADICQPLTLHRSVVEEGQRRPPWAAAVLQLEAAQQSAFDSPSAVAEAALTCVYTWRGVTDFDLLGGMLAAAAAAMQVLARFPAK